MILTGRAKEHFEYWLLTERNEIIIDRNNEYDLYYIFKYMLPNNLKCQLIIDWFDSVGVYINILNKYFQRWFYFQINSVEQYDSLELLRTRLEATPEAIKKANEIYNKKHD